MAKTIRTVWLGSLMCLPLCWPFPGSADVWTGDDCVLYTQVGRDPYTPKGSRQTNLILDQQEHPVPSQVCVGEWFIVKALGGDDCDNWIAADTGPPCDYTHYLFKEYRNRDHLYQWTVTGYCDRIQYWTDSGANIRTHCGIEALPDPPNGSGTITIQVGRPQADTYNGADDAAAVAVASTNVWVVAADIKYRSAGKHPDVAVAAGDVQGWFLQWSKWCVRDDDKPTYVPGGAAADNHECAQFVNNGFEQNDDINCQATCIGPPFWFATQSIYNVVYVNTLIDSNVEIQGRTDDIPGRRIAVSIISPDKPRTHGHEWGHNGGKSHNGIDWDIMGTTDNRGHNIGTIDVGGWSGQRVDSLP